MVKPSFRVVGDVITIDGITKPTYGISNGMINISDISLEAAKVANFCEILNSTGGCNDKEIVYELIDNYFAE